MLSCPPLQLQMSSCFKYATLNSLLSSKEDGAFTSEGGLASVIGDSQEESKKKKNLVNPYVVLKRHDGQSR